MVSNRNFFYLFLKWLLNDCGKIMVGFNFIIKYIMLYFKWFKLESLKLVYMVWVWLNLEIMNLYNRVLKELYYVKSKKVIKK